MTKNEENWEVEKIVEEKKTKVFLSNLKKGILYFVKWKNYNESENTWEPITNFKVFLLILDWEKIIIGKLGKIKTKIARKK